jgi:hypothetical protein
VTSKESAIREAWPLHYGFDLRRLYSNVPSSSPPRSIRSFLLMICLACSTATPADAERLVLALDQMAVGEHDLWLLQQS